MTAESTLHGITEMLAPITLPELTERAALQTRTDRKYFVTAEAFRTFAELMSEELDVLDIDGRRLFDYESVYFDSPQMSTYRAHLQRRRRRFKVRTRTYLDSGECMLEVKLEGHRGATVKQRLPHPLDERGHLSASAREHLVEVLAEAYGLEPPDDLGAVLTTRYRRATFTARHESARLTCDVGLLCENATRSLRVRPDHVLVESKAGSSGSVADRMLREMGVRPVRVSKYCVGVAGLHPEMPSNPWHSTLRRYFDWDGVHAA